MKAKLVIGIVVFYGLFDVQGATRSGARKCRNQKRLAAVTVLFKNDTGKAALGANFVVTSGIQTRTLPWPNLLPFAEQQQALRDVFITSGNLTQLAYGLGTTLGAATEARFHYIDRAQFTKLPPTLTNLINYALAITGSNSNAGKYFFANGTTMGRTGIARSGSDFKRAGWRHGCLRQGL